MPREEWRRSRQGKKVAGRRCGKSNEAQPSFDQIKPREVAWDALPDSSGRRMATRSADPRGAPRLGQQHCLNASPSTADIQRLHLSASILSPARRGGLKEDLSSRVAPRSTKRTCCIGLEPSLVVGTRVGIPFWPAAGDTEVRPRPAPPGAGRSRTLSRQGSSPSGAKRRSRFERSRRAWPEGRRQTLMAAHGRSDAKQVVVNGRALADRQPLLNPSKDRLRPILVVATGLKRARKQSSRSRLRFPFRALTGRRRSETEVSHPALHQPAWIR